MPDNRAPTLEPDCGSPASGPETLATGPVAQGGRDSAGSPKESGLDTMIRRIKTLTAQVRRRRAGRGRKGNDITRNGDNNDNGDNNGGGLRPTQMVARPVNQFLPAATTSFRDAGLTDTLVESLVLKFLLARGDGTGRRSPTRSSCRSSSSTSSCAP